MRDAFPLDIDLGSYANLRQICGAKLWTKCCYCLLSEVVYNVKIYTRPANYLTLNHKLDLNHNGALACITIRTARI